MYVHAFKKIRTSINELTEELLTFKCIQSIQNAITMSLSLAFYKINFMKDMYVRQYACFLAVP